MSTDGNDETGPTTEDGATRRGLWLRRDGPPDAMPLVLLHGLGASGRSWDAITPALAAAYRVVRLDLLGHGRSPAPPNATYALADQARRVGGVLDELGVDRAVVIGHSTGGMVATALGEQRPDLTSALVLINTGTRLDALTAPDITVTAEQWSTLTDEQIRRAMGPAFSRPGYAIPRQMVTDVRAVTHHAFAATLAASHDYLRERPLGARLAGSDRPLLALLGEDDRRWRAALCAQDYRPVATEVTLLPGLGHSPILEDPATTAAHLAAFLTTLTGGPGDPAQLTGGGRPPRGTPRRRGRA